MRDLSCLSDERDGDLALLRGERVMGLARRIGDLDGDLLDERVRDPAVFLGVSDLSLG